jgi:hypothetical protein
MVTGARNYNDFISWIEYDEASNRLGFEKEIDELENIISIDCTDYDWWGGPEILVSTNREIRLYDEYGSYTSYETVYAGNIIQSSFCDLDSDGDKDILILHDRGRSLSYFENFNMPRDSTGDLNLIKNGLDEISAFGCADLDGNGKMDILLASESSGNIYLIQVEEMVDMFGNQNNYFTNPEIVITLEHGIDQMYLHDLDYDGDLDFIYRSAADNRIAWYKNGEVKSGNKKSASVLTGNPAITLSPNPFQQKLVISVPASAQGIPEISIFSLSGRLVHVLQRNPAYHGRRDIIWDASNFPTGTYLIRVEQNNVFHVKKCVLIK